MQDLARNVGPVLRRIPAVASVTIHRTAGCPSCRVIHIADRHFVSRADFREDLLSLAGGPVKVSWIDREYAALLQDVATIQGEQVVVLREIIRLGGVSRVHVEGLFQGDEAI